MGIKHTTDKMKEVLRQKENLIASLRRKVNHYKEEIEVVKEILSFDYLSISDQDREVVRMFIVRCRQEIRDFLERGDLPEWMIKERQPTIYN